MRIGFCSMGEQRILLQNNWTPFCFSLSHVLYSSALEKLSRLHQNKHRCMLLIFYSSLERLQYRGSLPPASSQPATVEKPESLDTHTYIHAYMHTYMKAHLIAYFSVPLCTHSYSTLHCCRNDIFSISFGFSAHVETDDTTLILHCQILEKTFSPELCSKCIINNVNR